jgi:hypothetical protein
MINMLKLEPMHACSNLFVYASAQRLTQASIAKPSQAFKNLRPTQKAHGF